MGRVQRAYCMEARAGRAHVFLLSTVVRILRAVVLFGGRVERFPRASRLRDRGYLSEHRSTDRHRGQSIVPVHA